MRIQISSGQGPAECELAVKLLYDSLRKEYQDIVMVASHPSRQKDCFTSIQFETEEDLSFLEGSIQWICKSPFRPNHKRKNWFVDVSIISTAETISREGEVRFERFHSSGKGGQNVNKVETGVRLIHEPTGITVTSTAERSQRLNKKDAMRKLNEVLDDMDKEKEASAVNDAWKEHTRIVRGNPVRVYEGMKFQRKK